MDSRTGAPLPPPLSAEQTQAHPTIPNGNPNNPSRRATHSPAPSAASTPRRPSHPATSPLHQPSPKVVRRASSALSLNERPPSSPKMLKSKSSRTSLGAQNYDTDEKRLTPKHSISSLISGLREAQAKMELIEEPVPLTASQLASMHFERELVSHSQPENESETVVILHDACYGHRYSRLKTTKTTLSMIVERPERIHASVLGASTAYVRLGGHHAGAKNAPHPDRREAAAPPFKIRRTARTVDITSSHVTNVHGTAWMSELRGLCDAAGERIATGVKELSWSATPTDSAKRTLHEGDLYLCSESLNAFQGALGGVADAVDAVFEPASRARRAFVAIRPPGHHCSADYPSGFCWLNNVHVGIEYAAQIHGLTHAAILDFDLHHGDGSQAITWDRNSKNNAKRLTAKPNSKLKFGPDIGYYSLHDINSYPCETGDDEKVQAASLCIDNAHGQSIWNVHLQPWKTENEFWELYETRYRVLLDKARVFLEHHTTRLKADGKVAPKAALFISAGFDASEWEGAGMQRHKVNVPTEFYARFTRDVVELAHEVGTSCDGRVISVLEGGYSDRALCSGVLSHLSGLCATPIEAVKTESSGMDGLDHLMRGLGINGAADQTNFQYNKAWWSPANLTALEMTVNPPPPPQAKKSRIGQQPTYATPTESFAYKVVDANKFARSISGTMREIQQPARPPTPPPPDVDWVIATQELLKLLIPANRQTKSCTPEELAGPKVKKEPSSAIPPTAYAESTKPRQLRDRKAKAPGYAESTHSDETESLRSVSRSSRRQTIAELPSATNLPEPTHQRRGSRRLSAGSALSSIGGELDPQAPPMPALPQNLSRPSSSGMAPPSDPVRDVQVKKTRAPPVKKEPGSSAPASPKRTTKIPARVSSNIMTQPPAANDVDTLTAGIKKVTLKVGSREEHDRKQKEKVDADRRARALKAAETRRANTAAKKAAKENTTVSKPVAVQVPQKENAVPLPVLADAMAPTTVYAGQSDTIDVATSHTQPMFVEQPLEAASPVLDSQTHMNPPLYMPHTYPLPNAQEVTLPNPTQAINISDQSTIPAYSSTGIEQNLNAGYTQPAAYSNMLAPNMKTSTPPPRVARSPNGEKLPVWTSTGAIPFAIGSGASGLTTQEMSAMSGGASALNPINGVSTNSVEGSGDTAVTKVEEQGPSIWDVPETPPRP